MDRKYELIINNGKKSGKRVSEINAELEAAGANFHLDYKMGEDGPVTGWTEQEMEEGFRPGPYTGKVQKEVDMRRVIEFAGTTKIQKIPGGTFEVTYNEDGYATKTTRVN